MRARQVMIAAAIGVSVLASAGEAFAAERPPGGGGYVDGSGDPTAVATDGAGASPVVAGGGAPDPCHWEVVIDDDSSMSVYEPDSNVPQHSTTGRWLQKVCPGQGAVMVGGQFLVPEGGLVDPVALAQDALSKVGITGPAIQTSPAANRLVVHIPTWLWIDGGWWRTYRATASAGRVSSTVTARPVSTTWTLGDGSTVVCSGPGTPWTPGAPEDGSDCTHTYTTSSAGSPAESFEVSVTVQIEVSWTSTVGVGGTLPAISRSSNRSVQVGEIQAIGTR